MANLRLHGVPPPFLTTFSENVFCDLDLWTHDLQNLSSPWPDCGK